MPEVGDHVTYFDAEGEAYDAVVYSTYPPENGRGMIDVVYNAAGDGRFGRQGGARYDEQLRVETSVQEALEIGEPKTFTEGWAV